jgi:hypothetical protein
MSCINDANGDKDYGNVDDKAVCKPITTCEEAMQLSQWHSLRPSSTDKKHQ